MRCLLTASQTERAVEVEAKTVQFLLCSILETSFFLVSTDPYRVNVEVAKNRLV